MNSPPLAQLLSQTADALMAVRAGQSLTAVLARCPAGLRAGTQTLAFHGLRCLAGALALRKLLAPKSPPPEVDALLLLALYVFSPSPIGSQAGRTGDVKLEVKYLL